MLKYINISQNIKFKFCQVPRKILYTEPYKSILCPLAQLAYIFNTRQIKFIKNE